MSQVRTLGRVAIDRSLRIIRVPFDAAAHILPEDRGPRNAAMLAVDRADASVRATVADLLNDDVLRNEAVRRRAAADERQHALMLRARADATTQQADDQLANDLERTERLRENAERDAQRALENVAETTATRTAQAKKTAAAQERAADEALAARVEADEKRAKKKRLQILEEETSALDQETDALTATDEAQRLANAASSAKAARKDPAN